MPNAHARLSPSDSERWISCPAAIQFTEENHAEEEESVYAAEGTCAHALGELKARWAFGFIDQETYEVEWKRWFEENLIFVGDPEDLADMERHTDAYVELIQERAGLYPHTQVRFEQRLDAGVPSCWGTSDTVLVSPRHVEIIDFKYGAGVAVEADGNSQLRLYGCGALDRYGDLLGDTEVVRMTVHQPRMNHVLTEELTPDELRAWRQKVVIPAAELALGDDAPFGPSEKACRWCPMSGRCRAQLEYVFSEVDFEVDPKDLTPEEMGDIQDKIPVIRDWLNAFEVAALHVAYSLGKTIPGYKVVLSGGKRSIPDPQGAIEYMVNHLGYYEDQVARKSIRPLGELEKLMGKKEFASAMKAYIKPPTGKPALAREDDRRPAINPNDEAKKEFTE